MKEEIREGINVGVSVSFTGHRPEKLDLPQDMVISWIEEQVDQAIKDG